MYMYLGESGLWSTRFTACPNKKKPQCPNTLKMQILLTCRIKMESLYIEIVI